MTYPARVLEFDRGRWEAYDIWTRLLKDNIIFLGSPIGDDAANTISAQMLFLEANDPEKEISLYINSPGGSVTAGLAIFDTMRFMFADTPKRMWAHSFNPSWSPYRAGAGAHAWIEFEGGATCGYLCCFESHKSGSVSRIDTEGGTLELGGRKLTLKHREREEEEEIPLDDCPDSTTVIMNEWNKYLSDDVEPEISGRNNLTTVAMVEGCGVSSEEGRVLDFQEYLAKG